MMNFFSSSTRSLFDHILVYALLAMSQYVVLRAGVFSLGTAGFAALGAYATALLITNSGWPPAAAIVAECCSAASAARCWRLPLSRLARRVPALATLALVQIVLSATQNWVSLTNGALGVSGIPKVASTGILLAVVVVVVLILSRWGATASAARWT